MKYQDKQYIYCRTEKASRYNNRILGDLKKSKNCHIILYMKYKSF